MSNLVLYNTEKISNVKLHGPGPHPGPGGPRPGPGGPHPGPHPGPRPRPYRTEKIKVLVYAK